jgi:hypothetical protein
MFKGLVLADPFKYYKYMDGDRYEEVPGGQPVNVEGGLKKFDFFYVNTIKEEEVGSVETYQLYCGITGLPVITRRTLQDCIDWITSVSMHEWCIRDINIGSYIYSGKITPRWKRS